jgi:hypothetical protein
MDLRLATLKAVSFYLLHNVPTVNQCRKFSCDTVVCKHFASYQGYPNPLAPSDPYMGRTAQLTSRCCILNTYSTNIRNEYFKCAA